MVAWHKPHSRIEEDIYFYDLRDDVHTVRAPIKTGIHKARARAGANRNEKH